MFEIRAKGQNKGKLIEGQIYLALWPDISDYIAESYIANGAYSLLKISFKRNLSFVQSLDNFLKALFLEFLGGK